MTDAAPAPASEAAANPWKRILPAVWMWVLLLAASGVAGMVARFMDNPSPWLLVAPELVALPIILVCGWSSRRGWSPMLRPGGFGSRQLGLAAIALVVSVAWMYAYFFILEMLGVEYFNMAEDFIRAGWPLWVAFASGSLAPAVVEEIAFRGVIQSTFEQVGNPREALLIQAGMFSFLHLSPVIFVSHFGFGIILGLLRLRSRSLYPSMLVHALWNAWVIWQDARVLGVL